MRGGGGSKPPGFIRPALPVLATTVPVGDRGLHELKHDEAGEALKQLFMLPLVLSALLALVALSGPASGQQAPTVAQRGAVRDPDKAGDTDRVVARDAARLVGR